MTIEILNQSDARIPKEFLQWWVSRLGRTLLKNRVHNYKFVHGKSLILVFLSSKEAQRVNKTYRGKNYATDVLSFEPTDLNSLGELVFCPDVIARQAREHGLRQWEELGYLVIHGVLHLLGYDHEKTSAEAKKMFDLQDRLFENLCVSWEAVKSKRLLNREK